MAEEAGRGRLDSLDLLPDEAQDDVVWAIGELNQRRRSQEDIRFELNDRLAVKGLGPVSRSAFNRRSMRLAAAAKRLAEARHIFAGLADQFTPDAIDQGNIGLGEIIKTLIFELTDQSEGATPKNAMELGRAYLAVIQGQKISADRRRVLKQEFAEKASAAVAAVAEAKGLSAETVEAIKSRILGVTA